MAHDDPPKPPGAVPGLRSLPPLPPLPKIPPSLTPGKAPIPAPPAPDADPEAAEKNAAGAAAMEVGSKLKRCMLSYRLYGRAHERTPGVEEEMLRDLERFFDKHGNLRLSVSSHEISYATKVLIKDEKREEALAMPLFVDGVETLTLEKGLEIEGLRALLHIWDDAARGGLSSEYSFSTKMWEVDPPGVNLVVRDGFSEDARDRAESVEQGRFERLLDVLTTQALLEPATLQSLVVVKTSALSALAVVSTLGDAEEIAAVEAEPAPVRPPEDVEILAMAQNLRDGDRGLGLRTLLSLWSAASIVEGTSHEELITLAGRIIGSLFTAGRFKEVGAAMGRISLAGNVEHDLKQDFHALCQVLSQSSNIAVLLAALEVDDTRPPATELLGYITEATKPLIIEGLRTTNLDARAVLLKVLARFEPSAAELGAMFESLGEALANDLRVLAEQLGADHLRAWTRAGLRSESAGMRHAALMRFKGEPVEHHRGTLLPLCYDPDPKLRQAAIGMFVRAKDHAIEPLLLRQIGQTVDLAEQKAAFGILATLRGGEALRGMRHLFANATDPETRALAALALAQAHDQESIPAFEKESKRLLANRSVRAACLEALRRLTATHSIPPPEAKVHDVDE